MPSIKRAVVKVPKIAALSSPGWVSQNHNEFFVLFSPVLNGRLKKDYADGNETLQ